MAFPDRADLSPKPSVSHKRVLKLCLVLYSPRSLHVRGTSLRVSSTQPQRDVNMVKDVVTVLCDSLSIGESWK